MRLRFPALEKFHKPPRTAICFFSARVVARTTGFACLATLLLITLAPSVRAQTFEDNSRWELGGHYAMLTLPYECTGVANCQSGTSGFGGNLTYNFSSWVSLDSEMNFFPDNGNAATAQTGGQVTEGLFGLRVGPTTRKWGFYSVLRPGFVTFSRVLSGATAGSALLGATTPRRFTASLFPRDGLRLPRLYAAQTAPTGGSIFMRDTDFALNYGEAIEFRPTKHVALRFDIGDTIVSYPGASNFGPFKQHNFQISQAFVIRF
jgi:hypothetical protein